MLLKDILQNKKFLNFTRLLPATKNADDINLTNWANRAYTADQNLANQLVNDVNTSKSFDDAKAAVKQIYIRETTPQKKNEGYFANISTSVKAAAAFVIAASIASYFYFMRPWLTPSTQQ